VAVGRPASRWTAPCGKAVPSVYAAGDVLSGTCSPTARRTTVLGAVRNIVFPAGAVAQLVPWCTFTDPELAQVGLTEPKPGAPRRRAGVVGGAGASDRARAHGTDVGIVKVVT
jgi:pyruvate/2-oxoglutarate dehydrogenase complex dihydrolipoamide dehydrogenase (E3) component